MLGWIIAIRLLDHGIFASGEFTPCPTLPSSKNSSMGLSKLFVLPDERLRNVLVKGDMIISERQRNSALAPTTGPMLKLICSHYDSFENKEW